MVHRINSADLIKCTSELHHILLTSSGFFFFLFLSFSFPEYSKVLRQLKLINISNRDKSVMMNFE